MTGLPIETIEQIEALICPKCKSKIISKGGIGHSCYFDDIRRMVRSQIFKCVWCDLELILPVAVKQWGSG